MAKRVSTEKDRARAKRWYNAHTNLHDARMRAWRLANLERYRERQRLAARRRATVKVCATTACGRVVETLERQIKFCKRCSDFYRKHIWRHGSRRVA